MKPRPDWSGIVEKLWIFSAAAILTGLVYSGFELIFGCWKVGVSR